MSILKLLDGTQARLEIRTTHHMLAPGEETTLRMMLQQLNRDGVPIHDNQRLWVESRIDQRVLDVHVSMGAGAMATILRHCILEGTERLVQRLVSNKLLPGLDFALFALDHAEDRVEMAQGVQDLWVADQVAQRNFKMRSQQLLAWLDREP